MDLLVLAHKTLPLLFLLFLLVGRGQGNPQGDPGEPRVIQGGSTRGKKPGSLSLCLQLAA